MIEKQGGNLTSTSRCICINHGVVNSVSVFRRVKEEEVGAAKRGAERHLKNFKFACQLQKAH